jgi:hypothetical protein
MELAIDKGHFLCERGNLLLVNEFEKFAGVHFEESFQKLHVVSLLVSWDNGCQWSESAFIGC